MKKSLTDLINEAKNRFNIAISSIESNEAYTGEKIDSAILSLKRLRLRTHKQEEWSKIILKHDSERVLVAIKAGRTRKTELFRTVLQNFYRLNEALEHLESSGLIERVEAPKASSKYTGPSRRFVYKSKNNTLEQR